MADGPPLVEGVDYAWSRPDIAQLAAAGKRFACRYGGPGSDGKQLDPAEARALSAAGIAIVANAEGAADGLAGGWSVGVSWARDAEVHFAACGMPAGRPIYLSVDFNVSSTQWPAVAQALRGAASVLGASRVGVYGGRRAIEWARRDGVAVWFWQTYAWSSGVWVPGNHLEQYLNGVALAGATLDLDRALATDFGQWAVGEEEDMSYDRSTAWRFQGYLEGADPVVVPLTDAQGSPVESTLPNKPKQQLDRIEAKLGQIGTPPPATVDPAVIEAAVKAALKDPAVLAAIAKAVLDEDHKRSAA